MRTRYRIEEALYNHIPQSYWISSTRQGVETKFNSAMDEATVLILSGQIEVMRAVDMFGQNAFVNYGSSLFPFWETWQYDPLTGEYRWFERDRYYFSRIECSIKLR